MNSRLCAVCLSTFKSWSNQCVSLNAPAQKCYVKHFLFAAAFISIPTDKSDIILSQMKLHSHIYKRI